MRQLYFVVAFVVFELACAVAHGEALEACRMRPPCLEFADQDTEQTWVPVGPVAGGCDSLVGDSWVRQAGDACDIVVFADGPGGSGRFWQVAFGIVAHQDSMSLGGFCLETTTAGWRTLREFDGLPLPWSGDLDADGWPEFILWDSFPLYPDDQMTSVGYGLFAWVYEVNAQRDFVLSWELTREMAGRLLTAYRTPHFTGSQQDRDMAADYIEAFINGACEVEPGSAH